jgi:hypothetical protein
MKQTGFPNGRPGYVVDHITLLAKGGKDVPSNMQWQTIAETLAEVTPAALERFFASRSPRSSWRCATRALPRGAPP